LKCHSSRLEQVEDRISRGEDKVDTIGKNDEYIEKRMKQCERDIEELWDCIKRPNLQIMGIEEEEEM
jgi:chaperonin cofactor prefoldin